MEQQLAYHGLVLGRGFSPTANEPRGDALDPGGEPPDRPPPGQTQWYQVQLVEDLDDLASALKLKVGGSYTGLFSVTAEAEFFKSVSVHERHVFALATCEVSNAERIIWRPRLSAAARALYVDNHRAFLERYGEEYVATVIEGGRFFGLIEVTVRSQEQRDDVRSKIIGSGWGLSLSAEAETNTRTLHEHYETRVLVSRAGGVGAPVITTIPKMLEQLVDFPRDALAKPVMARVVTRRYENGVDDIPEIGDLDFALERARRDAIQYIGAKYMEAQQLRADIDFVISNITLVSEYRVLSPTELQGKRLVWNREFEAASAYIDRILRYYSDLKDAKSKGDVTQFAEHFSTTEPLPDLQEYAMNLKQLEERLMVPVGTILPFFGDVSLLSDMWVVCNEANAREYRGKVPAVPNLMGRFLMGVNPAERGAEGGRGDIPTDGRHQHGGRAGPALRGPSDPSHAHDFATDDDSRANHGHDVQTDEFPDHTHGGENRPPFTGVVYVIRVR